MWQITKTIIISSTNLFYFACNLALHLTFVNVGCAGSYQVDYVEVLAKMDHDLELHYKGLQLLDITTTLTHLDGNSSGRGTLQACHSSLNHLAKGTWTQQLTWWSTLLPMTVPVHSINQWGHMAGGHPTTPNPGFPVHWQIWYLRGVKDFKLVNKYVKNSWGNISL